MSQNNSEIHRNVLLQFFHKYALKVNSQFKYKTYKARTIFLHFLKESSRSFNEIFFEEASFVDREEQLKTVFFSTVKPERFSFIYFTPFSQRRPKRNAEVRPPPE